MELLRIITAGSVDDGKSTLIGRLFYDSKQLLADQVLALEKASKKKGTNNLDFSLLTDGLKEERAQGITIDVAYRYLTTLKRKYILADTPGHIQYTRNFITACSNSDIALLMVDAGKGVQEQTRRHTYLASMMGVQKLVFCINKMDTVDYKQEAFDSICADIHSILSNTTISETSFIPVSALHGDNIVSKSEKMDWYKNCTLMEYLDNVSTVKNKAKNAAVMPIQTTILTTTAGHSHRTYAGRIICGSFKTGDDIIVLPSGLSSRINTINKHGRATHKAENGDSISVALSNDIHVSRGNVICHKQNSLSIDNDLTLLVSWLNETPMQKSKKYIVRLATQETKGIITEVIHKINIHDFSKHPSDSIEANDIACIKLKTSNPLVFSTYQSNRYTGSMILVDPHTNDTVAACTII